MAACPVIFLQVQEQTGTVQFLGISTTWVSALDLLVPVEEPMKRNAWFEFLTPGHATGRPSAPSSGGCCTDPKREHDLAADEFFDRG
ncbi:MAG TPA: hypothetical protein VGD78_13815 [Chthoniobacterales bacterium]